LANREKRLSVPQQASVSEVTRRMKDANSGCALVVEGGKLVGIFTEHDVLLKLTEGSAKLDMPVREVMRPNPEPPDETNSVAEALNKMSLGRYRHLPFKKADGSYAVASIQSVLRYIAQEELEGILCGRISSGFRGQGTGARITAEKNRCLRQKN